MKVTTITSDQFIQGNYMIQTKVIGESVKRTNRTFVKSYTEEYCKALTKNYLDQHVRQLKINSERFSKPNDSVLGQRQDLSDYAKQQLAEIENGTAKLMKFGITEGRKYYKVVQQEFETWEGSKFYGKYRNSSVVAFVDKETGDVFKPAGWAKPAKHVRYDMRIINQRQLLHNPNFTGWSGGYLYMR